MSTPSLPQLKRAALAAAALCTVLSLSACGGDSVTRSPEPPTGTTPVPLPVANDSFFAYVMSRVAILLDNDEPADIDAVMETKPEDTEPTAFGS